MNYGERDLSTEERNAWQRSDYAMADTLAALLESQEAERSADELIHDAEQEAKRAENNLADLKTVVTRIADALGIELDVAKRCGNRAAIERQIQALYEAIK